MVIGVTKCRGRIEVALIEMSTLLQNAFAQVNGTVLGIAALITDGSHTIAAVQRVFLLDILEIAEPQRDINQLGMCRCVGKERNMILMKSERGDAGMIYSPLGYVSGR